VAPPRPDRGIDIVAFTDPLGASGPRIKAQVKRRADKIPFQEVRSFIAVLRPTDVGIFVANGGFTPEGIKEARLQESRRVSLLAVDDLLDLWVEYYGRIPEASRALLPLRPIYYLAPS
jgi:restriction system protein